MFKAAQEVVFNKEGKKYIQACTDQSDIGAVSTNECLDELESHINAK